MGKPKSEVWRHYTSYDTEANAPTVKCNYCDKTYKQGVATRMQAHLNDECNNAPENSKVKNKKPLARSFENTDISPSSNTSKKNKNSITLDNSLDTMSDEEQKKLEIMLAKALYSSNISADFIENPYVVELFKKLKPSFKLPNKKSLSDELLDNIYYESKHNIEEVISNAQNLTLVYCSNNTANEYVRNFIICTPLPFLYDSIYSEENFHTAEWIADQISKQIEKIGAEKFCSVITDTTSYMKDAWKLLELRYPHIICAGSASHVVNLLIGEIIKITEIEKTIESSKSIVKFFKQQNSAFAKLNNLTRWDSHLECLESLSSLFKSKAEIQLTMGILQSNNNINTNLKSDCLDPQFWNQLEAIIMILEPIAFLLKLFESNESVHSSIYPLFNDLFYKTKQINCQFKSQVLKLIGEGYESIYKDSLAVAYMLDPKYYEENNKLVIDYEVMGTFTSFLNAKYPDKSNELHLEFLKFRNKMEPYNDQLIWSCVDQVEPSLWWKSWPESELKRLAVKLLSIPTSPASAEQALLNVSFIHPKLRKHLDDETVKKLDYVHSNLNIEEIQNKKNDPLNVDFNDDNVVENVFEDLKTFNF
nr:2846_t:CDS:1 [Entrophospora candida]